MIITTKPRRFGVVFRVGRIKGMNKQFDKSTIELLFFVLITVNVIWLIYHLTSGNGIAIP